MRERQKTRAETAERGERELLFRLHERVGDLLASIGGGDQNDESATGNDEAQ
jgi:hypothetical protein